MLVQSRDHAKVRTLADIGDGAMDQIEHFFVAYHGLDDVVFEPLRRAGSRAAMAALERTMAEAKGRSDS